MQLLTALLTNFEGVSPATNIDLKTLTKALGLQLPQDYIAFLRLTNGGIGLIGKSYVSLWNTTELLETNKACNVQDIIPGIVLIGSDGGGMAYGFNTNLPACPVITVPLMLEPEYIQIIAPTFTSFLNQLHAAEL